MVENCGNRQRPDGRLKEGASWGARVGLSGVCRPVQSPLRTELTPWVPVLAQRKGEGVGGEGRQEGGEAGEGGMRAER